MNAEKRSTEDDTDKREADNDQESIAKVAVDALKKLSPMKRSLVMTIAGAEPSQIPAAFLAAAKESLDTIDSLIIACNVVVHDPATNCLPDGYGKSKAFNDAVTAAKKSEALVNALVKSNQ